MTTRRRFMIAGVAGAIAGAGVAGAVSAQEATQIRIGWQPTTTVEAQIAHTLQKTGILANNGLEGSFTMFSYGPAVNEALVSGAIDVGFIGDLPSVSLAAAGAPVTVVARQSTFRGSIIASIDSGVETMADLEGKQLYGPVGSSIHLAALGMLDEAGLTPGENISVLNMGFADLSDALRAGRIDAAFVWDPWVENFASQRLARVVDSRTDLTMVVAMRNAFIEENPDAVERFLKAHKEASLFAATNHERVNAWFREPTAAQALDPAIVETATAYDPQWSATTLEDLRLAFNETERERYLGLGVRAAALDIFSSEPPLSETTDMSIAEKVDAETWSFDPSSVAVSE